jgi:hypothetical protein
MKKVLHKGRLIFWLTGRSKYSQTASFHHPNKHKPSSWDTGDAELIGWSTGSPPWPRGAGIHMDILGRGRIHGTLGAQNVAGGLTCSLGIDASFQGFSPASVRTSIGTTTETGTATCAHSQSLCWACSNWANIQSLKSDHHFKLDWTINLENGTKWPGYLSGNVQSKKVWRGCPYNHIWFLSLLSPCLLS